MIANTSLFDLEKFVGNDLENEAFEKAKEKNDSKANFAIYLALKEEWNIPNYIEEGLIWLADDSIIKDDIMEVKKDE